MRRSGFSLIEALVAMVIAALALLAVFELQRQLAVGQLHYEKALSLASLQRNAITLTEEANPMAEPAGQRRLSEGVAIVWRSSALTPAQAVSGAGGGASPYEVRLYRTHVDIWRGARPIGSVEFDQLGWRSKSALDQPSFRKARP